MNKNVHLIVWDSSNVLLRWAAAPAERPSPPVAEMQACSFTFMPLEGSVDVFFKKKVSSTVTGNACSCRSVWKGWRGSESREGGGRLSLEIVGPLFSRAYFSRGRRAPAAEWWVNQPFVLIFTGFKFPFSSDTKTRCVKGHKHWAGCVERERCSWSPF